MDNKPVEEDLDEIIKFLFEPEDEVTWEDDPEFAEYLSALERFHPDPYVGGRVRDWLDFDEVEDG